MMRAARLVTLLTAVAGLSGCRAALLQKDQDRFRQVILDSYTNQIMDNLIRTANGMPIVVVDFTNITGSITDSGSAGATPSQTTTDNTSLTFGAILKLAKLTSRMVSRTFANTSAFSFNASHSQQLSVTGVPVIDKPDVYRAYLEFIQKPGSLIRDCNPPPPGVAHITRKVGDDYFFVPVEYRKEFFSLALKTTVMRGEPTIVPDYYPVKVISAEIDPDFRPADPKQHRLVIRISPPVPHDSATLKLKVKGESAPHDLSLTEAPGATGDTADTFRLAWSEAATRARFTPEQLRAALMSADNDVEIFLLHHHPPATTTTDTLLNSIFNQMQLQRLDNLRFGTR